MGWLKNLFCGCGSCPEKDETIVYTTSMPVDFESYSELKKFIDEDEINWKPYVVNDYDCDDFSRELQKAALKKGKILNVQFQDADGDSNYEHALNSAIIGNDVYIIEPQTDGVIKIFQLA